MLFYGELSLSLVVQLNHPRLTSPKCIYFSDAVKDCSDGSDESEFHCNSTIQYRLGNRKLNHMEGRVEVRYKGVWGTVCDDGKIINTFCK